MAEGIEKPEGTIANVTYGQTLAAPPGSESMACTNSSGVNVGDPRVLPGRAVSVTKRNQREYRNDAEEVRRVIVLRKQGNTCGGKDPGQHHPGRGHVVRPPESQATTATQLTRIAWLSARDPQKTCHSLVHHFNWWRVLDTAESSQVDQCVGHQLHAIMPLLDAFKAQ